MKLSPPPSRYRGSGAEWRGDNITRGTFVLGNRDRLESRHSSIQEAPDESQEHPQASPEPGNAADPDVHGASKARGRGLGEHLRHLPALSDRPLLPLYYERVLYLRYLSELLIRGD